MSKNKVIYKCAVNGVLGFAGKYSALCGKSKVGDGCAAHGNFKCEHKIRVVKNNETNNV